MAVAHPKHRAEQVTTRDSEEETSRPVQTSCISQWPYYEDIEDEER
jgi:hypothetical protein